MGWQRNGHLCKGPEVYLMYLKTAGRSVWLGQSELGMSGR